MTAQAMGELAKLRAAEAAVSSGSIAGSVAANKAGQAMSTRLSTMGSAMTKWGMSTQYAGRMLMMNFTYPLVLAGGLAAKWALDNEAAMVRVKKVYGDSTNGATFYKKEIVSLGKAFEALSNQFGISRADTTNIAADWAAAGSSGIALAKATKLTMETMILGEMSQAEATTALISIQAQYGQSIEELSQTIDVLNMVENQTGITMQGLVQGFQRAAGVARAAGIDVRHLAAMMAALVPAAGGAAMAGNAIKTIISRLMSPTKEAAQVMGLFGINVKAASWQAMNGSQQIEFLAGKYKNLSDKQKIVVSTTLGSRFQMNKLIVLLTDVNNKTGYYHKSLDSTAKSSLNLKQRTAELNMVLDSNPRKLEIIKTNLQNMMTDVIQPLLPIIVGLAGELVNLFKWFQNLNPSLQKFIGVSLLGLAVLGPLLRYLGSFKTMLGFIFKWAGNATKVIGWLMTGLWKLASAPFRLIWIGLSGIGNAVKSMASMVWSGVKAAIAGIGALFTSLFSGSAVEVATVDATGKELVLSTQATTTAVIGSWEEVTVGIETVVTALHEYLITGWSVVYTDLLGVTTVFSTDLVRIWAGTGTTLEAFLIALHEYWLTGWTVLYTNLLGITTGYSTELVVIWDAAGVALFTSWVAMWAAIEGATAASLVVINEYLMTFWATLSGQMLAIETGLSTALVTTWTAMWAEMTAISGAAEVILEGEWWVTTTAIEAGAIEMAVIVTAATQEMAGAVALAGAEIATVGPAVVTGFAGIGPKILAFVRGIGPAIARAFQWMGGTILGIWRLMGEGILTAIRAIGLKALGLWGLIISIILGLMYSFRTQIKDVWFSIVDWFNSNVVAIAGAFRPLVDFFNSIVDNIEKAFWRLPQGITSAFMSVVNIVRTAALKVREFMSYLNPFQRHSPSLVDNVKGGMRVVKAEHKAVGKTNPLAKATQHLDAYKAASGGLVSSGGSGGFADELANVTKSLPSMLPMFNTLIGDLGRMNSLLNVQKAAVDGQQRVVDAWQLKLDAANKALDTQSKTLDGLQKHLDSLTTAYDAHKAAMEGYANAPIQGMKAMNDAIWANDQAQKALQLRMLDMGSTQNLDKLRAKYAALQGDIEMLSAKSTDLRMAGAGSDITGPIDAQIKALQAQQVAVDNNAAPLQALQNQLDALGVAAQKLDLENALKFGPLQKQVTDLTGSMKELPFSEIIAGVQKEQGAMNAMQPSIDAATAAVDAQKTVVDRLTAARDAVSASYDTENAKLKTLNDTYQQTKNLVDEITSSLHDMGSAASAADTAKKAKKAKKLVLTPGGQNFVDSALGNFPDVGGTGKKIGRELLPGQKPSDLGKDQSKAIDEWVKQNTKDMSKAFGNIDMFAPIKNAWNKGWKWMETNVGPVLAPIGNLLKSAWSGIVAGASFFDPSSLINGFLGMFSGLGDTLKGWWDGVVAIFKLFQPDITKIFAVIVEAGKKIWNEIGPELQKFGPVFGNLKQAFTNIWTIITHLWTAISPLVALIGGLLLGAIKVIVSVVANVLKPILDTIIDVFKGVIQVIRGVIEIVVGVFAGDWRQAWQGVQDIFAGVWEAIFGVLEGAVKVIWGFVSGLVVGVVGFFKWLYDTIIGHSIIPDLINGIVNWFKNLIPWVVTHVTTLVTSVVSWFASLPQKAWTALTKLATKLGESATTAFAALASKASAGWTTFATWVTGLPQKAWTAISGLAAKLGSAATTAFAALGTKASAGWTTFATWVTGLPQKAWTAISGLAGKLSSAAGSAFQALKDKAVSMVEGKGGFMSWITGIPGKVAKGLGAIGGTVAGALKSAWNGVADWLNKNGIARINGLLKPFHFSLGTIPRFAKGGVVGGPASKTDNQIVAVRGGEGIVVPEAVRALGGARGIAALNAAALHGKGISDYIKASGMRGYAGGGTILGGATDIYGNPLSVGGKAGGIRAGTTGGWLGTGNPLDLIKQGLGKALKFTMDSLATGVAAVIPGKPFIESFMVGMLHNLGNKFGSWGTKQEPPVPTGGNMGAGTANAAANQRAAAVMIGAYGWGPGQMNSLIPLWNGESGWNQFASNGNSGPDSGSAYGIPQSLPGSKMASSGADWRTNPITQMDWGLKYIKNRPDYGSPAAAYRAWSARSPHWYDEGGWMKPGDSGMNGSTKPEPVFTASQWVTLSSLVAVSTNVLKSLTTGDGALGIGLRGAALVNVQTRMGNGSSDSSTTTVKPNRSSIHFHGDLSFPNIKNGDDAKSFIRNLESLAG